MSVKWALSRTNCALCAAQNPVALLPVDMCHCDLWGVGGDFRLLHPNPQTQPPGA